MSLSQRAIAEEAMDAADLDPRVYAAVLHDLARVNAVTLAARPTLAFLDRAARASRQLRILDVGFGAGDMLRTIARWADRRDVTVDLVGIDLNPNSAAVAAGYGPAGAIRYLTGDYRDLAGQGWDVVLSSLVAHHMTPGELTGFLRFMDREARVGWFVNDLHRHRAAHLGYPVLARLMRAHPIVRSDGQLSIARAFRSSDWHAILAEAGVSAQVRRRFPFRLCVERLR
ncbi:2-polyprenyl-3-methyl-5-hydroxy-6-metoxy-1,4-benzoquinol methylase [Sphingomonas jejuensis]|uniref:2-polyprenyl-3-methyl-5-hydroxy-6-metoxy-1, 4-benzoquinol methylase n=1 Tax=Sphingomonas jejuensis TaxID=904715 RepID=A0ABX0XP27_9SPHN|nr:methyltransferase domain-containing protein [Sphingomonas jejuensis]NJC35035.1 2-polyprenyl-3-methyl-5-hydroxy-6-metoxy-1,4-benzoquinol methylase [Sphingomonas jejuensis]